MRPLAWIALLCFALAACEALNHTFTLFAWHF